MSLAPLPPLRSLHNRGNTCWAASVLQALRALRRFVGSINKNSLLGVAVGEPEMREDMVPALFTWCRACLKNEEGSGFRQADPSELLMELFDRKDVNTACFENKRTTHYQCLTCGHERRDESTEKMLIITSLPSGSRPVQRAVDMEFGYDASTPSPFVGSAPGAPEPPEPRRSAAQPSHVGSDEAPRGSTTALCTMQISSPSLNRRQIGASVSGARPNAGFRIPNARADWTPKTRTRRR